MSQNLVLHWIEGDGWLVLSGGADALGEIRAQALARLRIDGYVAYIGTNDDDEDELLDDMGDLGAPTGYLVNVLTEDDHTIRGILQDAAMVVVPGDVDLGELRSALQGAGAEGIQTAYERGAVILFEGAASMLVGKLVLAGVRFVDGFGWLEGAFVVPSVASVADSTEARDLIGTHEVQIAVGIGEGSALVLGPNGQIETWGKKQVTVALGGFDAPS